MKLDAKIISELAIRFNPRSYVRIMRSAHAATPLGMGFGQSRFSSPDDAFCLVYIAYDVATAIAETLIRDRFEGQTKRTLHLTELTDWHISTVSASRPLIVVDLRTTGLLRLGVSTDAARAKSHATGRLLAKALYEGFAVDGILYHSRLTAGPCVAIFDRAVGKGLTATEAIELIRYPALLNALGSLNVTVQREDLPL